MKGIARRSVKPLSEAFFYFFGEREGNSSGIYKEENLV